MLPAVPNAAGEGSPLPIRYRPQVAEAAHGKDLNPGGLNLCAQPRDMDLDGVGRELLTVDVEQAFAHLLLAEHAAWACQD